MRDSPCKIVIGKPEEKKPLVRRSRKRDNNKVDIKEIGCDNAECIDLA